MSGLEDNYGIPSEFQGENEGEGDFEEEPEADYVNPFRYVFYR